MIEKISSITKLSLLILLYAFILLGMNSSASAQSLNQEYSFKHYTVHDGLAQMQVMSLFQDSKGYLWCSTKAGISRFDGTRFVTFPDILMSSGHDIVTMGETANGILLLFGTDGFVELSNDTTAQYTYPHNAYSSSLMQHSQSLKLKEIHVADDIKEFTYLLDYADPQNLNIHKIPVNHGPLVLIDEIEGIVTWHANSDSIFVRDFKSGKTIISYVNPGEISRLFKNKDCIYGTNGNSEVFKLTNGIFNLIVKSGLENRYFKSVATPGNEGLILKTDKELFLFDGEMHSIKSNLTFVRDILYDNEENLWVATEEGLYNFFQLNFVNFDFNMGNKDWVWSVLEDKDRNFWFASYQNGLWKWDGSKVTDYTKQLNDQLETHVKRKPLPEQYRYYMGASKHGSELILPTEFNVLKYDYQGFSPVKGLPELPFQITKSYADGTLYCAGYAGLFEIQNDGNIKSWTREELDVSSVLNLERDKNNQLLVVGKDGATRITSDDLFHFSMESLKHSYSLAKDHKNNVWIGGIRNLHLYNGDSIKFIESRAEEAFYSMLFVQPHYLFLGGIKGLYIANLQDFYSTGIFETMLYNQSNGFTGIECGQNGFLTDSEGMVWIPTSDLVTRFDPQKIIEKHISAPKIYLNMSSSSDNIHWANEKYENLQTFSYKTNNLRFIIDAVSFTNSGNLRFYYKLSGLQNQWSEATMNNEIVYYNLRPGTYKFLAKTDAGISKTTSETITIEFTIAKPFWTLWWFIMIVGIFIITGIFVVIQYFRKQEKKRSAIQHRLTHLRSEALAAQLDPHFVMNCLNNISGMVNAGHKTQANEYIVMFSKLLRVILQSVKKETISLKDELEMLTHYLKLEQFRCNNCFSFDIIIPKQQSSENILVPPMMLQPLVENSIKHGFGQKKITDAHIKISLEVEDKNLHIRILDNGSGIQRQSKSLGTGLGTKITRERIELLQKRRNIQFELINLNPGTEVRFHIPLVLKNAGNTF